jgi:hypothetical protein
MSYFKTEYQRFLDNPKTAKLADDVSLIYVPTTTKFEQADNVITHVLKNANVVKTKSNQVISAIEGSDSLCLDMETTLDFTEGGGVYLPSLDDNFLADRVAIFPTVNSPTRVALSEANTSCRSTSSTSTPINRSSRSEFTGIRPHC